MSIERKEFESVLMAQRVADRVAARKQDGERFYDLMKKEWASVSYDPKTGKGTARVGTLGVIHWTESGNDSAVIVEFERFPTMKARAEDVADALEKIAKIVDNTSL